LLHTAPECLPLVLLWPAFDSCLSWTIGVLWQSSIWTTTHDGTTDDGRLQVYWECFLSTPDISFYTRLPHSRDCLTWALSSWTEEDRLRGASASDGGRRFLAATRRLRAPPGNGGRVPRPPRAISAVSERAVTRLRRGHTASAARTLPVATYGSAIQ
jgi:hypothetical protein